MIQSYYRLSLVALGIFIYVVLKRFRKRDDEEEKSPQKDFYRFDSSRSSLIYPKENIELESNDSLVQPVQCRDIHLTSDYNECRQLIEILLSHCDTYAAIGFDCEWVSAGSRGRVALLQLASHRGFCVLIRLCKLRRIPKELIDILADVTIVKVGVDPKQDANYIKEDYGIAVNGTVDLRYMAELAGCQPGGLKKMSYQYLNSKSQKNDWRMHLRWEDPQLSIEQINYAAKDATDGIGLFIFFSKNIQKMETLNEFRGCLDKNYVNLHQTNTKNKEKKKKKEKKQKVITANAE